MLKKEKINRTLKKLEIKNKYIKYFILGLFITGLILIPVGIIHSVYYNNILFSCTETHFTIETPAEFEVFGKKIDICITVQFYDTCGYSGYHKFLKTQKTIFSIHLKLD